MSDKSPLTEADLHAYVDGQLSPGKEREVEAFLAINREAAIRVRDYRRINGALRALYDPLLAEPVATPLPPRSLPRLMPRVAAILASVFFGAFGGWFGHGALAERAGTTLQTQLTHPAAFAHVVYGSDLGRPVEIGAGNERDLESWLSRRLHAEIHAPDLQGLGFRLMGGRLLPSTDRMAAQFMYEGPGGKRVTLYSRRVSWSKEPKSFHAARDRELNLLYWVNGSFGYALVSELPAEELLRLAKAVHQQLA